jgi:hypothetical protein
LYIGKAIQQYRPDLSSSLIRTSEEAHVRLFFGSHETSSPIIWIGKLVTHDTVLVRSREMTTGAKDYRDGGGKEG